jgi:hypothetical protein
VAEVVAERGSAAEPDQPLVQTTRSYLYKMDHLMMNLSRESELLHEGFSSSVRLNDQLELEIQGWNRIYTMAQKDAHRHLPYHTLTQRNLEAEHRLCIMSHPIYKNINRAIIYAPGSSHAYIRQNHQDITTRISK